MRQRVHESIDDRSLRRGELHVLAAARINGERLTAEHPRHVIGVQAGGVDDDARVNLLALGAQHHAVGLAVGADELRSRQEDGASIRRAAQKRLGELLGIDDAGLGRPERHRRIDGRLAFDDELAIDDLETFDAVGVAARLQRLELLPLAFVVRDDELSRFPVGHALARAELVQQAAPFDAEPRLQRARRIVHAGMDDAAVVRARVHPRTRMPLEHAYRLSALGDGARRRESGHTRADHRNVNSLHRPR